MIQVTQLSLTFFANDVLSAMQSQGDSSSHLENAFEDFGSRHSQVVQVLVARKFGKVSLQLNPLYLHTNYVEPNDQENLFAIGGAIRWPLSKKFVLIADYFHTFRSQSSIDSFASKGIGFHDPFGIGFEIITEGHVFHLNFTNQQISWRIVLFGAPLHPGETVNSAGHLLLQGILLCSEIRKRKGNNIVIKPIRLLQTQIFLQSNVE